jgi:hypothetical protein
LRKITLNADIVHHRFSFMRNDIHKRIIIYLSFKINVSAMVARGLKVVNIFMYFLSVNLR